MPDLTHAWQRVAVRTPSPWNSATDVWRPVGDWTTTDLQTIVAAREKGRTLTAQQRLEDGRFALLARLSAVRP